MTGSPLSRRTKSPDAVMPFTFPTREMAEHWVTQVPDPGRGFRQDTMILDSPLDGDYRALVLVSLWSPGFFWYQWHRVTYSRMILALNALATAVNLLPIANALRNGLQWFDAIALLNVAGATICGFLVLAQLRARRRRAECSGSAVAPSDTGS